LGPPSGTSRGALPGSSIACEAARMKHLALPVSDQERSRRFYESYLGFGARPARRYDGGVLMLSKPPCLREREVPRSRRLRGRGRLGAAQHLGVDLLELRGRVAEAG